MNNSVYLAGPISGLNYENSTDWRNYAIDALWPIRGRSPMRGKEFLKSHPLVDGAYSDHALSTQAAIVARDRNDVLTSDLILVNFLGAARVSIGTVLEVAWADAFRKPIVLVMEPNDNLHEHTMIRQLAGFHATTLDEAIQMCHAILD